MTQQGFDRLKPRSPAAGPAGPATLRDGAVDAEGRRALFSTQAPRPAFGSVAVTCSSCHQTSVLTYRQVARALVPSLHVPIVRRSYPSLMRCPACARLSWQRLRVRF